MPASCLLQRGKHGTALHVFVANALPAVNFPPEVEVIRVQLSWSCHSCQREGKGKWKGVGSSLAPVHLGEEKLGSGKDNDPCGQPKCGAGLVAQEMPHRLHTLACAQELATSVAFQAGHRLNTYRLLVVHATKVS